MLGAPELLIANGDFVAVPCSDTNSPPVAVITSAVVPILNPLSSNLARSIPLIFSFNGATAATPALKSFSHSLF